MITIPKNTILKSKGLGDTIGDIVESFNLDLNSNYGAIRTTRTKNITVSNGVLDKAVGFCMFNGNYYFVCNDYVYKGGEQPADSFSYVLNNTDISNAGSDIKVFNNAIYVVVGGAIYKSTDGDNFSSVIASGITSASPHILENFADRLYITDNYTKVRSISTSDVLTTDGQDYSINLNLGSGTSSGWTITSLKQSGSILWIGLTNQITGKGLVYSWDGSAQIPNDRIELSSGVVAGTVLDGVFYIIDLQGALKKFNGSSFTEVARFTKENTNFLNTQFVHYHGMQPTDKGTIQILMSNLYAGNIGYEDKTPSGIWEYDSNIGLYHKYSCSISPVGGTTLEDYGHSRIANVGALCVDKPLIPSNTDNGTLLFSANYYTDDSTTEYGIFCEDTLDTTQKYAYFITSFMLSDTEETWQKIYTTYKKLLNSYDKIILKYRIEDDTPTTATITFTDIDRFIDTADSITTESTIVNSYSETNQNTVIGLQNEYINIVGQSFSPTSSGTLTSCSFYLKKVGSPTGNINAKLYNITGTLGDNNYPTTSPIATSDNFDISTLTTSLQTATFTFSGVNQVDLVAGQVYGIAIENLTGDTANYLLIGVDNSSPTHAGNTFTYDLSLESWSAFAGDTIFSITCDVITYDNNLHSVGDEIQVLQGTGAGKTAHIKEISGRTYILDDNFPTAVIGLTTKANISHWIKLGEATYSELKQIKVFTSTSKNVSPFFQLKVCMQFTGKNELYKLKIISDKHIKE